jgi:hypothetical protein
MALGRRGIQAFRAQAEEASKRRMSGYANYLLVTPEEPVLVRFRGLFYAPAHMLTPNEAKQIYSMQEWLLYYLAALGMAQPENEAGFLAMLEMRYTQFEPFIYTQHYIARNQKGDAYMTCAEGWEPRSDCAACWAKDNGDKAVSTRTQNVFSAHPRRLFHRIERKGMKDEYVTCSTPVGEPCRYCSAGHEPTQESVKYLPLADMHAAGVIACADRVQKRCVVCQGLGTIRHVGWACSNPECGSPLSINVPYPAPADIDLHVVCPTCGKRVLPEETLTCSRGCATPRRAQLHDVDVLVQKMGSPVSQADKGKGRRQNKVSYQFTEQWPAEPLPEDMLAMNLPIYELALAPPNVRKQCQQLGLTANPFSGETVGSAADDQAVPYDGQPTQQPVADPFGGGNEGEPSPLPDADVPF